MTFFQHLFSKLDDDEHHCKQKAEEQLPLDANLLTIFIIALQN